MFDQLPNVRLSGENHNVLFKTSELLNIIHKDHREDFIDEETIEKGFFMGNKVEGAFQHNPIPIGSFSCVLQHLFQTLNPPPISVNETSDNQISSRQAFIDDEDDEDKKILGMKGIRVQEQDILSWTPEEAAAFLQEHFPCSRYIINISTKWRYQSKTMMKHLLKKTEGLNRIQVKEIIQKENDFLTELNTLLGTETSRLLDLEDWQNDVEILNNVVRWLGFENCKFDKLAHENRDGFFTDETKISTGENCIYPHV